MTIQTTHQGAFDVISNDLAAAIVRGSKVGPLFSNATDAIDWGNDTACGDAIPPGYDIAPLQGAVAGLVLLFLAFEYKQARK